MQNINEKQVIEFLRERQQLLKEELKKVENTISVIESSNIVLSGTTTAKKITRDVQPSTRKLEAVQEFKPHGRFDERISYALTKLKSAYKEDILEVLLEEQPDQDVVKLQNALGVRLSYLLKNNLIDAEKHGRKFYYTMK
ncbi:soluble adenylyl cyclase-like protein [Albibacterium profundi]|uniref:Soluble adenylyl cyclase-like protein n=1 Tax=Albibacterium profundi TaxID=3134906 RepID=A0ABV5CGF0_9SPHI